MSEKDFLDKAFHRWIANIVNESPDKRTEKLELREGPQDEQLIGSWDLRTIPLYEAVRQMELAAEVDAQAHEGPSIYSCTFIYTDESRSPVRRRFVVQGKQKEKLPDLVSTEHEWQVWIEGGYPRRTRHVFYRTQDVKAHLLSELAAKLDAWSKHPTQSLTMPVEILFVVRHHHLPTEESKEMGKVREALTGTKEVSEDVKLAESIRDAMLEMAFQVNGGLHGMTADIWDEEGYGTPNAKRLGVLPPGSLLKYVKEPFKAPGAGYFYSYAISKRGFIDLRRVERAPDYDKSMSMKGEPE